MEAQENTTEEFIYYHYDNFVLLAKKGNPEDKRDVYHYNSTAKSWERFYPLKKRNGRALWGAFLMNIKYESDTITPEELEERGIPLVEDDGKDITSRIKQEFGE